METNRAGFPEDFRPQRVGLANADELADMPPAEIAAYFREHSDEARALYVESGDKRWTPSSYIDGSRGKYRVGWISRNIKVRCEAVFDNLADAATDYLLFSLGKGRWSPDGKGEPKDAFLIRNGPASKEAIADLIAKSPVDLGFFFISFLRTSNGATGDLGIEPGNIVLWRAEDIVSRNKELNIAELAPGMFAFGSDGGNRILAFDLRGKEPWPVLMFEEMEINLERAMPVARDFIELVGALGGPFTR